MKVYQLAKEKVGAAYSSDQLAQKWTTSVKSQKITQLIGPIGDDEDELKKHVQYAM